MFLQGLLQPNRILLFGLSASEAVSGVLKSKGKGLSCMFRLFLVLQTVAACLQSMALVHEAGQDAYSKFELAAAYLTVSLHAFTLVVETFVVARKLHKSEGRLEGTFASLVVSVCTAVTLGLSLIIVIMLNPGNRFIMPFKLRFNAVRLLFLPVSQVVALALASVFLLIDRIININKCGKYIGYSILITAFGSICFQIIFLGVTIRFTNDNLSLLLLTTSNLIPAFVTVPAAPVLKPKVLHEQNEQKWEP